MLLLLCDSLRSSEPTPRTSTCAASAAVRGRVEVRSTPLCPGYDNGCHIESVDDGPTRRLPARGASDLALGRRASTSRTPRCGRVAAAQHLRRFTDGSRLRPTGYDNGCHVEFVDDGCML
ncbi:hypothetical protein AURDEDRAFT_164860 [Auricularia subglabra TFB-10046 SS5]|nr:hypothetical protein AURDEDRAFT_164860 [Auricularia subglabra TFB-10046 SS5]